MARAIIKERKSQTRRVINPQPIIDEDSGSVFNGRHTKQYDIHNWKDRFIDDFSRWVPEDIIWVRETAYHNGEGFIYKADKNEEELELFKKWGFKWKPSMFMSRAAARILLEVTNVRVEKLQDISESDAVAEGIKTGIVENYRVSYNYSDNEFWIYNPKKSFQTLWQKLNGEESWDHNPWVWVIEFKKI